MRLYLILLSGLLFSSASQAHRAIAPQDEPAVQVEIVADNGRSFSVYPHSHSANTWRAYLEVTEGSHYAIRVRNQRSERVGIVIAVDGRNIISGARSDLKPQESMYILNPYETATYRGWRSSAKRIQRFYFTQASDSYAGAWGDYSAMGVIAVAAYQEKSYSPQPRYKTNEHAGEMEGRSAQASSDMAKKETYDQAGTGYGEQEYSSARRVYFKPLPNPVAKLFYKYEWRSTLCQKRIISCGPVNRFWPESREGYGFAPYPPNRY